ncbi:MAG: hypothetical protein WBD65_11205 [Methylocella sp.]
MANHPAAARKKRTRSKNDQPPDLKFEIIYENSNLEADLWSKLRRNLGPLIAAASNALGEIYSSVAQVALERKEECEDRRAERKARQRIASRAARRGISAPETHLVEAAARFKYRLTSTSKYSG